MPNINTSDVGLLFITFFHRWWVRSVCVCVFYFCIYNCIC